MKKLFQKIVFIATALFMFSCEKDEKAVNPVPKRETVEIEIGFPYDNQVFYSCVTNSAVSTNKKDEWDLSFDCSDDGFLVRLNVSKGMLAANTGSTDFEGVTSATGVTWKWDRSDGSKEHTAIGQWFINADGTNIYTNNVYIINRQKNILDETLGFKKIVFTGFSDNKYQFKYANLDGTDEQTFELAKDAEYNRVYFNFDDGGKKVNIEPKKNEWDLLFTNYQHKFDNLPLPFVITGVLLNSDSNVEAAEDSIVNFVFDDITAEDISLFNFSKNWDKIGYEWKIINRIDDSFTIDTKLIYIVKANNGTYYKVRFTDFYNKLGAKGYPTFEIEKL